MHPNILACREQLESHDLSQTPLLGDGVDKHDVSIYICMFKNKQQLGDIF